MIATLGLLAHRKNLGGFAAPLIDERAAGLRIVKLLPRNRFPCLRVIDDRVIVSRRDWAGNESLPPHQPSSETSCRCSASPIRT